MAALGGDLLALTTVWGNVPVGVGARNNLALLDLAGLDVPVALGAAGPSNGKPAWHAEHVHGADGQGGKARPAPRGRQLDPRPAHRLIAELAREQAAVQHCRQHPQGTHRRHHFHQSNGSDRWGEGIERIAPALAGSRVRGEQLSSIPRGV